MSRWFLGIVAAGFVVGGLILTFVADPGPDDLVLGGILLRAGMLLGAWWLVLPSARRLRPSTWTAIAVVAGVLVFRPRLVLWGLVAAVAVIAAGRRAEDRPGG